MKLNKLLYKYSPFPDFAGTIRNTDNYVSGSKMQTITYKEIFNELDILNKDISKIINNKSSNLDDYIKDISYIHYRLTIIHPFIDRNGRTARAFLNWLLVKKNFCPIYIDSKNRNEYLKALQEIDINNNYEPLEMIIIKCIINSVIDLRINKKDI